MIKDFLIAVAACLGMALLFVGGGILVLAPFIETLTYLEAGLMGFLLAVPAILTFPTVLIVRLQVNA